jgi:hypothetical protein
MSNTRLDESVTLTFYMKPREKAALEALAEDDSSSQAAVLRRLIRRAAKKRDLWPPTTTGDASPQ